MANILRTIIENDKGELRRLEKMAKRVMAYEDEMAALSDEALKAKTDEFKQRYQNGESLDDLLYEAFAVVREGAKRVLGLALRVWLRGRQRGCSSDGLWADVFSVPPDRAATKENHPRRIPRKF